ncbi:Conserved_hypothetical protein [Hexamita inflata]|uniref:Uncharacterized protein n=1 Tax=Hexamita inflata TaxID=28002 RepID=A0AA86U4L1_9EUKA|nr:Conserved hypothetical protein [Hexamita inflata]
MVKFDEETNLKKFNTYSQVVIKKYINDKITTDQINSMLTQLCALAEYVWKNEFQAGELKKYNVKLQLRNALITDTSTTQIIAECFIDTKIDQIIDSNSTKDLSLTLISLKYIKDYGQNDKWMFEIMCLIINIMRNQYLNYFLIIQNRMEDEKVLDWRQNKDITPDAIEGKTWRWTKQGWRATCDKQKPRQPKTQIQSLPQVQSQPQSQPQVQSQDQHIEYLKQILETLNRQQEKQKEIKEKEEIKGIKEVKIEKQKPIIVEQEVVPQKIKQNQQQNQVPQKKKKPLQTQNPYLKSLNIQVSDDE